MTVLLARAVMKLAMAGIVSHRQEWAAAMRAEFAVAAQDGEGLPFACGCLTTAWRELPMHPEGRLALSRYCCASGLILPVAAILLVGVWWGYPWVEPTYADGIASFARMPTAVVPTIYEGNAFAMPGLAALLVLRIFGLILAAWFVVEADWDRAAAVQRAGASATITLALFSSVAFADFTCAVLPLLAVGVELLSIPLLQRWHDGGDIAAA